MKFILTWLCLATVAAHPLAAQAAPGPERWNLYFQATSIGQYHGSFRSSYSDVFSLANHPEAEVSITSTLFFGLRLGKNTQFYCDPELAGGRGFSGTNGIANFPNGEMREWTPLRQNPTWPGYMSRRILDSATAWNRWTPMPTNSPAIGP
jgi:high affinity Mn2+ porin